MLLCSTKNMLEIRGHGNEVVWAGSGVICGKRQLKLRCSTRLIWTEGSGLRSVDICNTGTFHGLVFCLKTFTVEELESAPGQSGLDLRCPGVQPASLMFPKRNSQEMKDSFTISFMTKARI
jgi:hypothetical protein